MWFLEYLAGVLSGYVLGVYAFRCVDWAQHRRAQQFDTDLRQALRIDDEREP